MKLMRERLSVKLDKKMLKEHLKRSSFAAHKIARKMIVPAGIFTLGWLLGRGPAPKPQPVPKPKVETIMVQTNCTETCTVSKGDFVFKIDMPGKKSPHIIGLKVARIDVLGVEFSPYQEVAGAVVTGDEKSHLWRVSYGEERQLDERAYRLKIKVNRAAGRKAVLDVSGLQSVGKEILQ